MTPVPFLTFTGLIYKAQMKRLNSLYAIAGNSALATVILRNEPCPRLRHLSPAVQPLRCHLSTQFLWTYLFRPETWAGGPAGSSAQVQRCYLQTHLQGAASATAVF